jgi:Zn-dependent peptidase ImmA (M78 family)/DNA-binding XRE family transcriptional regulator
METDTFNPDMLALAREANGMTQSAFARSAGISQSKVSKIEEGLQLPTQVELSKWATLLGQPVELFSFGGPATPASVSFYRKTAAFPIKMFNQCNARMNLRRIEIIRRIGSSRFKHGLEVPHLPVKTADEAVEAAQTVRKIWKLPAGPVANLVRLIEQAGCIVDHFDFGTERIDGLAIGGGTSTPFIFLNKKYPADRLRLSLAHELAHLVMHRELKESVEDEAWAFAAEFLMPAAEIRPELCELTFTKLAQLKLKWQVSMQALLTRAKNLGSINERNARFMWMRMGQYGYRKSEPLEDQIVKEKPRKLEELMDAP